MPLWDHQKFVHPWIRGLGHWALALGIFALESPQAQAYSCPDTLPQLPNSICGACAGSSLDRTAAKSAFQEWIKTLQPSASLSQKLGTAGTLSSDQTSDWQSALTAARDFLGGSADLTFDSLMDAPATSGLDLPAGDVDRCVYAFENYLRTPLGETFRELVNEASSQSGYGNSVLLGIQLHPSDPRKSWEFPKSNRLIPPTPPTRPDGSPFPKTLKDDQKLREFTAGLFERMVRIAVAGSKQLSVDHPDAKYSGKKPIRGLYQGYLPDLLGAPSVDQIVEFPIFPEAEGCQSTALHGIANTRNGESRWFKSASTGQYENDFFEAKSGDWSNHVQCSQKNRISGPASRFLKKSARVNGESIQALMELMAEIRDEELKKGFLRPLESRFQGWDTFVAQNRAKIGAFGRLSGTQPPAPGCERLQKDLDALRNAVVSRLEARLPAPDPKAGAKALLAPLSLQDCSLQASTGARDLSVGGSGWAQLEREFSGKQQSLCFLASAAWKLEALGTAQLAYCQWSFTARSLLRRASGDYYRTAQKEHSELRLPTSFWTQALARILAWLPISEAQAAGCNFFSALSGGGGARTTTCGDSAWKQDLCASGASGKELQSKIQACRTSDQAQIQTLRNASLGSGLENAKIAEIQAHEAVYAEWSSHLSTCASREVTMAQKCVVSWSCPNGCKRDDLGASIELAQSTCNPSADVLECPGSETAAGNGLLISANQDVMNADALADGPGNHRSSLGLELSQNLGATLSKSEASGTDWNTTLRQSGAVAGNESRSGPEGSSGANPNSASFGSRLSSFFGSSGGSGSSGATSALGSGTSTPPALPDGNRAAELITGTSESEKAALSEKRSPASNSPSENGWGDSLMGWGNSDSDSNQDAARLMDFGTLPPGGLLGHAFLRGAGEADPADYLQRIGRNESLFHKVKLRYQEKALEWERSRTRK